MQTGEKVGSIRDLDSESGSGMGENWERDADVSLVSVVCRVSRGQESPRCRGGEQMELLVACVSVRERIGGSM